MCKKKSAPPQRDKYAVIDIDSIRGKSGGCCRDAAYACCSECGSVVTKIACIALVVAAVLVVVGLGIAALWTDVKDGTSKIMGTGETPAPTNATVV